MALVLFTGLLLPVVAADDSFDKDEGKPRACRVYERTPIPQADTAGTVPAKCDSEELYYGFTAAPQPAQARQCAYRQRNRDDADSPLSGAAILTMIYANGRGAARNFDLALRFACEAGGAGAEISGRVAHLEKLKAAHFAGTDFDFCNDITSGYMEGACADRDERLATAGRQKKLNATIARWSDADRKAFAQLQRAAEQFFTSREKEEVDLSGTARAALMIEERAQLDNDFVAALADFEAGKLPHFTEADDRNADARLNAVYAKALKAGGPGMGTVTPEGIRKTQRLWIPYRDQWVVFGRQKYPSVAQESWKTWVTEQRIKQLQDFVDP